MVICYRFLADFAFDVFKEVIAEIIVEIINPALGLESEIVYARETNSKSNGILKMISNVLKILLPKAK